jgi:type I restriction enzyme R subunit
VANKFQTGFDQPLLCGMYVDKMLGGIQAVQTLSRLNRAHPGKDTTYILDFVNEAGDILKAFKTYYETAELEAPPTRTWSTTCAPSSMRPATTTTSRSTAWPRSNWTRRARRRQLDAAIAPVADRLLKRYKARSDKVGAEELDDDKAAKVAKDALDALVLFKGDMGAFVRLYAFLSQIFDYGNTDIEKRFMFYKRLMPLLEFGRERDDGRSCPRWC